MREPIVVRFAAVALAAAMSDCGWTDYHEPKSGRRGLRPCDVMLFAADMTKLERFGSEQGFLSGAVVDFVYALEERYLMSDFRRGHVIAERGLVRIQGALWLAKLGVQLGRRELPRELDDHVRAMELK